MTGYDLKAYFNNSVNFFWSAKLSQIYRELSKLEAQGFVLYEAKEQEGRPNKKVYSVTEEGKEVFLEWLKAFPAKLSGVSRNEFLVRVFFSSKLHKDDLKEVFKKYLKEREEELYAYGFIEKKLSSRLKEENCPIDIFYQRLTIRRGLRFAQAEIDWAQECMDELQKI
jgi:DNA-binding PadR family transcriptional regulator